MIPFVDLRAQYLAIKDEIDEAVLNVLDSTQFVLGKDVAAFEQLFGKYTATDHAMGVNSGTSALHLALLAAGVERGDVILRWNDIEITGPASLSTEVAKTEIGSSARIVVWRDGHEVTLGVTVGLRPEMPTP